MPLYDLKCVDCDFEVKDLIVSVHADFPPCTKCGGKMQVDFSKTDYGIVKRGGGWTPGAASTERKLN